MNISRVGAIMLGLLVAAIVITAIAKMESQSVSAVIAYASRGRQRCRHDVRPRDGYLFCLLHTICKTNRKR